MQTRRLPERIPFPVTVSFGTPLPADDAARPRSARPIHDLDREAWAYRKADRRPLHHEFIRRARRHPFRLALADADSPRVSAHRRARRRGRPGPGAAAALGGTGRTSASCCRPSVAAALVNLAAALVGPRRRQPELHRGPGRDRARPRRRPGCARSSPAGPSSRRRSSSCPTGVEPIWLEDVRDAIAPADRAAGAGARLARSGPAARAGRAARRSGRRSTTRRPSSSAAAAPATPRASSSPTSTSTPTSRRSPRSSAPGPTTGSSTSCRCSTRSATCVLWLAAEPRAGAWSATPTRSTPRRSATWSSATGRRSCWRRRPSSSSTSAAARPAQFGSLRLVIAGAEKLPEPLSRAFEDAFGIRPLEGYGMTECSPVVAVSTLDYRAPGLLPARLAARVRRPSAAGRLGPDRRPGDAASRSARTSDGMVLVKGPNVMQGYLGRDDLTAAAIRDGWYVTGDIGLVDDDGFLKITGRLSRFSKIGGEMVPHGRVEEALHQAIGADEQVFAVTAVGDGREGRTARRPAHGRRRTRSQEALEKLAGARSAEPVHPPPRPLRQGRRPADPRAPASSTSAPSSGSPRSGSPRRRPSPRFEKRDLTTGQSEVSSPPSPAPRRESGSAWGRPLRSMQASVECPSARSRPSRRTS